METQIQFLDNINEPTIPLIKLTKSRNGKTGTATFLFINPFIFNHFKFQILTIKEMSLLWGKERTSTKEIKIIFKEGKPYLVQALFIFKNAHQWYRFLSFMQYYSKERELIFTDF
jgi:photosystem II protein